jgi:hypothetical protein
LNPKLRHGEVRGKGVTRWSLSRDSHAIKFPF